MYVHVVEETKKPSGTSDALYLHEYLDAHGDGGKGSQVAEGNIALVGRAICGKFLSHNLTEHICMRLATFR